MIRVFSFSSLKTRRRAAWRRRGTDWELEIHAHCFTAGARGQRNGQRLCGVGDVARRGVAEQPHAAARVVAPEVIGVAAAGAGLEVAGTVQTGRYATAVEILADDIGR